MKYEEPNMQILVINGDDLVRTSNIEYDPDRFPTENGGQFPTRP